MSSLWMNLLNTGDQKKLYITCWRESRSPCLDRVLLCLVGLKWVSWEVRYLDKPHWRAVAITRIHELFYEGVLSVSGLRLLPMHWNAMARGQAFKVQLKLFFCLLIFVFFSFLFLVILGFSLLFFLFLCFWCLFFLFFMVFPFVRRKRRRMRRFERRVRRIIIIIKPESPKECRQRHKQSKNP